jgi:glucosylceramidase
VRIASSSDEVIRTVAFKNPDSSLVIILFNDSDDMKDVQVRQHGKELLNFNLAVKSAMTIMKK